MKPISLCFTIHQPFRLKRYHFFDLGADHYYYDDYANEFNIRKMVEESILPSNQIIYDLIAKHGDKFKVSFAISGTALDQFELYAPEAIDSFKKLAATKQVEFICETNSESLSSVVDLEEFADQVNRQRKRIKDYFKQDPKVFCNTQMIYSNEIGDKLSELGFQAVLAEGAKHLLGWKSPNYVYCSPTSPRLKLLLRNWQLSDDMGFHFSNKEWSEYPLTADKFANWLSPDGNKDDCCIIALDYSFFGERNTISSGIFEFLKYLPTAIMDKNMEFKTLEEISQLQPIGTLSVNYPTSWADEERDLTAWMGNELQQEAIQKLYSLSSMVKQSKDPAIALDWRYLQSCNHFRFMSTKYFSTTKSFAVPSPYESPYDAFINYMNVLSDFALRVKESSKKNTKKNKK